MKKHKRKLLFLLIFLFITIVLCLFLIFKMFFIKKNNSLAMKLDFNSRVQTLENFDSGSYHKIGWLQVQGTNIDFPILDSSSYEALDSLDYSYGWRSPIYVTGENREVLIGHNIINVSSTPMLTNDNLKNFESLLSFSYASFAKDNLYIQYTKDGKDSIYLIYAIGFYDYYYDSAESMKDKEEIKNYIHSARENSLYDYDVDVNENDTLLSIKTCTRYFGNQEKQQFIIDARKLRDDEEIIKYSVKTSDVFEKIMVDHTRKS